MLNPGKVEIKAKKLKVSFFFSWAYFFFFQTADELWDLLLKFFCKWKSFQHIGYLKALISEQLFIKENDVWRNVFAAAKAGAQWGCTLQDFKSA